jgi:PST family polysaccharide transporter/lipopolysaccharide exporter
MLGTSALGIYNMGWNISRMPRDRLWALLNPLAIPLFSRSRSEPHQLGEVLCKLTSALAIVSIPAVAGLAAVAYDAVDVLLGSKWLDAVPVLRLLCVFGLVRALSVLWAPALFAADRTASVVRFNVACVVLLPAGFVLAAQRGIVGVACVWAVLYSILALAWLLPLTLRATEVSLSRYVGAVVHPFFASAVMVASVLAVGAAIPAHGIVRLAVTVTVGAAVYVGVLRALTGPITEQLRSLLREIRDGFGTETERLRKAQQSFER